MSDKIKLNLNGIQENVSLAPFTTFKIGGKARYFLQAKTQDDVVGAIRAAREARIPYLILGGGSNILASDHGYQGLVIRIANTVFEHLGDGRVRCGAGLALSRLIYCAKEINLGGIEYMAGIPGTVGGAVYGNAGAWGRGFGEVVKEAVVYRDDKVLTLTHDDLGFVYRGSAIKKNGGIIMEITIILVPEDKKSIQEKTYEVIKKRNKAEVKEPSAGCVFKNIDLKKIQIDKEKVMKALDLNEEEYGKATNHDKLPVGFIIDRLGLKEKIIGRAKISECHGAYIVNMGGAKAEDVVMLMSFIKTKVRNHLGIQLEEEVQLVRF